MTQRSGLYFGCVQESRWKGEGVKTMRECGSFWMGAKDEAAGVGYVGSTKLGR